MSTLFNNEANTNTVNYVPVQATFDSTNNFVNLIGPAGNAFLPTTRTLQINNNGATPAINTNNYNFVDITNQTTAITSFTSGLTGTPIDGQRLWIAVTGTGAVSLTWGSAFEASTIALPTTTVTTARLDIGFIYNAVTSKWRCVAVA
jgi:hypothetical protein